MSRLDLGLDWNPAELGTDDWYTPPHIFDALGLAFDLDPAAPEGGVPWIPAAEVFSVKDDGLLQPWRGCVWLNPPYSQPKPWLERLRVHGDGIALLSADTATSWWHDSVTAADVLCFLKGRLRFIRASRGDETSAMFPSVLVAFGGRGASAVAACGLGWIVDQREAARVS